MQSFTFLGCKLTFWTQVDIDWMITRFNYARRTIRRAMKGKAK